MRPPSRARTAIHHQITSQIDFFAPRLIPAPAEPTCIASGETFDMQKSTIVAMALVLATSSCATPKFQADVATQLRAAADEMQLQRQDMALMQEQIDSLKVVLVRQDSTIRKLANLAGIPGG